MSAPQTPPDRNSEEEILEHNQKLGAFFLGTKGENKDLLLDLVKQALDAAAETRAAYRPEDESYLGPNVTGSKPYKLGVQEMKEQLAVVLEGLSKGTVPFWSMRYMAHMNWDVTLPGAIGYMASIMYNPNNVAVEASPYTTQLEIKVGQQLCDMIGFPGSEPDSKGNLAWGHITCDGSVANAEALWAARNLKYFPVAVATALKKEGALSSGKGFKVECSDGVARPLIELDDWALLNLPVETVPQLAVNLSTASNLPLKLVDECVSKYTIQTRGVFDVLHHVDAPPPCGFITATRHYSWPKAAMLLGLGQSFLANVPVDKDARMDIKALDEKLQKCLESKTPVMCVVVVCGSTEEGAVDPIWEVFNLREKYRKSGLEFYFHVDAAWGGYFATVLEAGIKRMAVIDPFVPTAIMGEYVLRQLYALRFADSVTIDPHKAGYVPYPAGSLNYRNGTVRGLVSVSAPVVYHGQSDPTVGIYGIEGSKPGAAASAVYLSHQVIGLGEHGSYKQILKQAVFTSRRIFCLLVTLPEAGDQFQVVTLNRLPGEKQPGVPREKDLEFIRKRILNKTNREIFRDKEALAFLGEVASDLNINMFAINFLRDGKPNQDIARANILTKYLFRQTSLAIGENAEAKKVFFTSTDLDPAVYGAALKDFKKRLGFQSDPDNKETLSVLINSVMNPWATAGSVLSDVKTAFRKLVLSNLETKDLHGFVMTGSEKLIGCHLPMFNVENHRFQCTVEFEMMEAEDRDKYLRMQEEHPDAFLVLGNHDKDYLENVVNGKPFLADCFVGVPGKDSRPFLTPRVRAKTPSLILRHFDPFDSPSGGQYFVFGTEDKTFMEHRFTLYPDYQQVVQISLSFEAPHGLLSKGFQISIPEVSDVLAREVRTGNPPAPSDPLEGPGKIYDIVLGNPEGAGSPKYPQLTIGRKLFFDNQDINE